MRQINLIKASLFGAIAAVPMLAAAGNIPQYEFSRGTEKYVPLTDATPLPCSWATGRYYVLPGGGETPNAFVSEGFDLGMTFRLGGQEFNRFVITNEGQLLLGKDQVTPSTSFDINFFSLMYGTAKADISYKTEGEEGNKIFTLQFANAFTSETTKIKGNYNLQMRLHQADGRVELIFNQIESPWTEGMAFNVGITGWNDKDVIYLTGSGLRASDIEIGYNTPVLLKRDTTLKWDYDDYEEEFTVDYIFTPVLSQDAPAGSPSALSLTQENDVISVNCKRDPNAAATVILVSNTPFTAEDYPTDGVTFNAGPDTMFGNATAIYYGNDKEVTAQITDVKPDTNYYVQALSVTGYPVYGKGTPAEMLYHTTQAAPVMLEPKAVNANSVNLSWRATNPVIIAKTTEGVNGWEAGYKGVFGQPSADVAVGDIIPGGGEVIYVGTEDELLANADFEVEPNELTYFRAWTVLDGVVSATSIDAAGTGTTSIPFEPAVEDYPLGLALQGWDASSGNFVPFRMAYNKIRALRAVSVDGASVVLNTPALPLDKPTRMSFEFSLETVRPATASGELTGNEPGKFGDNGSLTVSYDGKNFVSVNQYTGTMTPVEDGYEDGSSTMQLVEFELPALGDAVNLQFRFNTATTSYLYLRDIKIWDPNSSAVEGIGEESKVIDFTQPIYTVAGVRVNATSADQLPAGLYIVGGKKVIVK